VRIVEPARHHGIADEDVLHALRNPVRVVPQDDVDVVVGVSRAGLLLEIGVLHPRGNDPQIIRAMPCRASFNPYL
jgi:hypothetical protein